MKRRLSTLGRVCVAAALLTAAGCAAHKPSPLPTYHGLDDAAALRVLAERAASMKTLSAQCGLTLTRADGQSVQLDGAIAMAPPDRLRLRAWKFGQAVFDLTLTPQGLWVLAPGDEGRREKVLPASLGAAQFGREWAMLNGGFFLHADLTTSGDAKWLDVRRRVEDGRTILCRVDRVTLTPRQYEMRDPQGGVRLRLALANYQLVSGTPWPMKLNARSGDGRIEIRLKDVELNQELPPSAFKPPRRAEKHE
jgi:outer membrane lipoprotein-sorting protein